MIYPVYDCSRHDITRDCTPIGHAANETEALRLLARHYRGTGRTGNPCPTLNDHERFGWAFFDERSNTP